MTSTLIVIYSCPSYSTFIKKTAVTSIVLVKADISSTKGQIKRPKEAKPSNLCKGLYIKSYGIIQGFKFVFEIEYGKWSCGYPD